MKRCFGRHQERRTIALLQLFRIFVLLRWQCSGVVAVFFGREMNSDGTASCI